jgi:hypothetical protein
VSKYSLIDERDRLSVLREITTIAEDSDGRRKATSSGLTASFKHSIGRQVIYTMAHRSSGATSSSSEITDALKSWNWAVADSQTLVASSTYLRLVKRDLRKTRHMNELALIFCINQVSCFKNTVLASGMKFTLCPFPGGVCSLD